MHKVYRLIYFGSVLLVGLGWLPSGRPASAQIQISDDFESGALQSFSVTGSTIRLTGEPTWAPIPQGYRWVYFKATGVQNLRPNFLIGNRNNEFVGQLEGHRFVYSYDDTNWQFFDSNRGSNNSYMFRNDEPFTQDEVYVAYSAPHRFSRTVDYVNRTSSSWFVSPTASANSEMVIDQIRDLPLFGFKITNPLIGLDKTKVVLVGGNHSGEMGGTYALEGMLDFLISDDPRAVGMRDVAEFYVYPQVDPLGRTEGHYRGNSQNSENDHNRFWDALDTGDNGGFSEITTLANAMRVDTNGDVDYTFDFHGFFDSSPNFLYSDTKGLQTEFTKSLLALETDLAIVEDNRLEPTGILEYWAKTEKGLKSDYSFTPEFSPNRLPGNLLATGSNFGVALFDELGRPARQPTAAEMDRLSLAIQNETDQLSFDLNKDGSIGDLDRRFLVEEIWGSVFGDSDLDGEFSTSDLTTVFQAGEYEDGVDGNSTWATGDWSGDFEFSTEDLVLVFQEGAFEKGPRAFAGPLAPEPASAWMFLLGSVVVERTRKRSVRSSRDKDGR